MSEQDLHKLYNTHIKIYRYASELDVSLMILSTTLVLIYSPDTTDTSLESAFKQSFFCLFSIACNIPVFISSKNSLKQASEIKTMLQNGATRESLLLNGNYSESFVERVLDTCNAKLNGTTMIYFVNFCILAYQIFRQNSQLWNLISSGNHCIVAPIIFIVFALAGAALVNALALIVQYYNDKQIIGRVLKMWKALFTRMNRILYFISIASMFRLLMGIYYTLRGEYELEMPWYEQITDGPTLLIALETTMGVLTTPWCIQYLVLISMVCNGENRQKSKTLKLWKTVSATRPDNINHGRFLGEDQMLLVYEDWDGRSYSLWNLSKNQANTGRASDGVPVTSTIEPRVFPVYRGKVIMSPYDGSQLKIVNSSSGITEMIIQRPEGKVFVDVLMVMDDGIIVCVTKEVHGGKHYLSTFDMSSETIVQKDYDVSGDLRYVIGLHDGRIAVASKKDVLVFSISENSPVLLNTLQGHESNVKMLAKSSNEGIIFSVSLDLAECWMSDFLTVKKWNVVTGICLSTCGCYNTGRPTSILNFIVLEDGNLVTGAQSDSEKHQLKLWDSQTSYCEQEMNIDGTLQKGIKISGNELVTIVTTKGGAFLRFYKLSYSDLADVI